MPSDRVYVIITNRVFKDIDPARFYMAAHRYVGEEANMVGQHVGQHEY